MAALELLFPKATNPLVNSFEKLFKGLAVGDIKWDIEDTRACLFTPDVFQN